MIKWYLLKVTAILCCAMTMAVLAACSSDDGNNNLAPGVDSRIVGNWCSDVSGNTYAKWNYGETWQNTEFKADGTGSTRIYYTIEGKAIGIEKSLLALYPTQQEAIDRASKSVYRYQAIQNTDELTYPFFDLANYAQLLAKETDDAEMKAISATIDNAFEEAFVHYRDVNNSKQHLDHYTLSICLLRELFYTFDYQTKLPQLNALNNYNEGYEKCDFHSLTGWGNWLNTNQQALDSNPQNGSGGKLE